MGPRVVSERLSIEITSRSEEETVRVGRAIARAVGRAVVITLEGELGSGKTRLTWGLAEGVGIDRRAVSSPTFAIVHEYEAADGVRLIHADAYRVDESESDDLHTLLGTAPGDRGWIAVIEWASRIEAMLPDDRLRIRIAHAPEGARSIRIEGASELIDRVRSLIDEEPSDG